MAALRQDQIRDSIHLSPHESVYEDGRLRQGLAHGGPIHSGNGHANFKKEHHKPEPSLSASIPVISPEIYQTFPETEAESALATRHRYKVRRECHQNNHFDHDSNRHTDPSPLPQEIATPRSHGHQPWRGNAVTARVPTQTRKDLAAAGFRHKNKTSPRPA
jgi:hypothetical protein